MRIPLGTFSCSAIRTRLQADLPTGVKAALTHYIERLESSRPPVEIPWFCLTQASQEPEVTIDLKVDAETRAPLEREAEMQRTSMDRLVTHAVLVYLADLDVL
jgi:hypothetical protein